MRSSPPALRNREPIADVLAAVLPTAGLVLEVASGSGEHVVHFARRFPHLDFQPSDPDAAARRSIEAHAANSSLANIRAPIALDAASAAWPVAAADAVLAINMIHISPWSATVGLIAGAARLLPSHGLLYFYGPYVQDGVVTAPSNVEFDASLKARNPDWGLRLASDVAALAASHGFALGRIVDMPMNNISLLFQRG